MYLNRKRKILAAKSEFSCWYIKPVCQLKYNGKRKEGHTTGSLNILIHRLREFNVYVLDSKNDLAYSCIKQLRPSAKTL